MTLAPGTRLGPYEILTQIGSGGMGEVYRARDTRLDRTVAIKVLPAHIATRPELRQRFEREARIISSLNHPHICTLHDVGQQDGIEYLVMEYLEGETLGARLVRGPLPLDQVLRYSTQTADALALAHRQGVFHRDLKPGNIMLTKSGVKLLDFGLAKWRGPESALALDGPASPATASASLTQAGAILGTLHYMSPEQLNAREVDGRTDLFAFGAVLYEMVTARKAFDASSQAGLIAAIVEGEPRPITSIEPNVPPGLVRVVKRCLAKDPDQRWQSAADLQSELEWIAEGSGEAGGPAVQVGHRLPGFVEKVLAHIPGKSVLSAVSRYVIGPLLATVIALSLLGRVTNWWSGPEAYKIYLVGDRSDPEVRNIFDAFKAAKGDAVLKIDGVPVRFEERDDRGDATTAQQVSALIAAEDDVLMVVGHSVSSQTKAALPSYVRANPPIPVILTTETTPDLLPPGSGEQYYPVLRLSATDDMQAAKAAEYATRKSAQSFWVVEDWSNPVYSKFLALEFIKQVQAKNKAVLLWSANLTPPSVDTFRALKVDCVFFAGQWSSALILVPQVRAIWQSGGMKLPLMILSDAAADPRLLQQGGATVEGVYLTHGMKASEYTQEGYKAYGRTAYALAEELIRDAEKRFASIRKEQNPIGYWFRSALNIHRASDARAALRFLMHEAVASSRTFHVRQTSYRFKYSGGVEGPVFHVWQVQNGRFVDAE